MQCVPRALIIPDDCECLYRSRAMRAVRHQRVIAEFAAPLQPLARERKRIRWTTTRSSLCCAEQSRSICEFVLRAMTVRDFSTSLEMTESWMTHGIREKCTALRR